MLGEYLSTIGVNAWYGPGPHEWVADHSGFGTHTTYTVSPADPAPVVPVAEAWATNRAVLHYSVKGQGKWVIAVTLKSGSVFNSAGLSTPINGIPVADGETYTGTLTLTMDASVSRSVQTAHAAAVALSGADVDNDHSQLAFSFINNIPSAEDTVACEVDAWIIIPQAGDVPPEDAAVGVAPPCRLYPREDGLGISSGARIYPPPRSEQRSNRQIGGYW